jgi:hypothetical protein
MSDVENTPQVSQDVPDSSNQVVDEARAQGWVDVDEFRGNKDDWVDAETFVRRGREIMPILRKNNEKLLKELNDAKRAAEEAREAAKEFREYQRELSDRKVKELQSQIEQLKQAKREAISSGDGDRVIAIDDAIDDIKMEQQQAQQDAKKKVESDRTNEPALDPNLNAWLGRNEWFGKDVKMTSVANGVGEALRRERPDLVGTAFLEELDKELGDLFPEKLGKTKRQSPFDGGVSSTTGGRPVGKGKRSYEALPSDAKQACDRFVKQGLMTREQYVSDYSWE